MATKTRIRQEQVSGSASYGDGETLGATMAVPSTLDVDMDRLRTLIKDIKGGANWYTAAPVDVDLAQLTTHVNASGAHGVNGLVLKSGIISDTDSTDDIGASGTAFRKLYVDAIDLNGQGDVSMGGTGRIDLDADDDTSIRASADDVITFEAGANDRMSMSATALYPAADDGMALGSANNNWADVFIADAGVINMGDDQDITVTHSHEVGLVITNTIATDNKPIILQLKSEEDVVETNEVIASIEFAAGDSDGTDGATVAAGIHAIAEENFGADANATKLVFTAADSETAAASATAKMTLASTGNLTTAGSITAVGSFIIGSADLNEVDMEKLDGITNGAGAANKALVLDGNADIASGLRNVTITGTLSDGNYTFDTSGNVSGLGTVGCGAITSTGNLGVTGTITGDTSLTLDAVTITTAEIGVLDSATPGTSAASKAMVTDASGDILMPDGDKFELGASSDMALYHDGTNSYIANKTGALKIATETSGIAVTIGHGTSEVTVADNLTVAGNLTVTGTTVTDTVEVISTSSGVLFEGGTDDGHEATLISSVAGGDITYTLPNLTGHVPLLADAATAASAAVTAAEMALLDGGTARSTVAVADGDGLLLNDGGTMKMVTVESLAAYYDDEITSMPNLTTAAALVTVSALNAGSITSGFGAIDNGSSNITTTGIANVGELIADDVSVNGKVITMEGSTSDLATFTVGTHGTLDITTVDDAAAAANITITADGTFEAIGTTITLDSGGAINLEPAAGSAVLIDGAASFDGDQLTGLASVTSTAFVGTLSTAAQTNITSLGTLTALTVDDVNLNGKVMTMTGNTGDTAVFTVGTNGDLSIVTTDAAAAAANIQITADGTVDIDSAGLMTLDSGGGINLEPAAGSNVLIDGAVAIDAGVVTGVTSLSATAIDGVIGGDTARAGTFAAIVGTSIDLNGNLDMSTQATIVNLKGNQAGAVQFNDGSNDFLVIDTTGVGTVHVKKDNAQLTVGAANDMFMMHDGTNCHLQAKTGHMLLSGSNANSKVVLGDAFSGAAGMANGGIQLAASVAEYNNYITNFGAAASIVSALVTANGAGSRAKKLYSVTGSHAAAKELKLATAGLSHDQGQDPAKLDVYVNGQLLTSGTSDANGDYKAHGIAANELHFFFQLEAGDQITTVTI